MPYSREDPYNISDAVVVEVVSYLHDDTERSVQIHVPDQVTRKTICFVVQVHIACHTCTGNCGLMYVCLTKYREQLTGCVDDARRTRVLTIKSYLGGGFEDVGAVHGLVPLPSDVGSQAVQVEGVV